jgi:cellulose biosynthesis protein BcsQ
MFNCPLYPYSEGRGMQTIAFFNHKGGVGKTTMLFNLAIEMSRMDKRVLMVDLDAQANLSAISLSDDKLDELYAPDADGLTVAHGFSQIVSGAGDIEIPEAIDIRSGVWLAPGDIALSDFEGILPGAWTEALAGDERGFRVTSAPYRMVQTLGAITEADYAFIDLGPNVGALNRAVIIGSDYLVVPMASDLFSLRALPSVGKSVDRWVSQWATAQKVVSADLDFNIPKGRPKILGYVSQQFNIYRGDPTLAFQKWIEGMDEGVSKGLLDPLQKHSDGGVATLADPALSHGAKLGTLKNFHSLVPHAQTMRQEILELEGDDVIRGAQITRANESERDFYLLCDEIIQRT